MAETINKNQNTETAAPAKPKLRRGINNETRGTTRLKFDTCHARPNGLFIAHIDSIEVKEVQIGEETSGLQSFAGLSVPRLVINFSSNEEDVNKRKYIQLRFLAVESNVETIPGGKSEWKVQQIFDYLKHFYNVFVLRGREMTEDEINALALDLEDVDENGEYVPVAAETVVAAWKSLFENFANLMNTGKNGSPVYFDNNGKPIAIWMKLIRFVKNGKNVWKPIANGELAFPTFVGEGVIEIFKQNTPPSIRVNIVSEDIKPRKIESAPKVPNMPMAGVPVGGMGMGMPGGMPIDSGASEYMNTMAGMANEIGEDLPEF